ncbi:MAG: metallophosphoesterase [Myxococcales bacterium]|nr:metallophosphoesterase [Myxococcales bacterium]
MRSLGFDWFFLLLLFVLAVSVEAVLRALAPGRFERPRSRWIARALIMVGAITVLAIESASRSRAPAGGGVYRVPIAVIRSTAVALWVSSVLVTLWHLVAEIVGRTARAVRGFREPAEPAVAEPVPPPSKSPEDASTQQIDRRSALVRVVDTAIITGVSGAVGYGLVKGRSDFRVREIEVRLPKLPRALDGYTIVQLTDLHVGVFAGPDDFRPMLDRTRALRPDAIVLTGDLVDRHPRHVPDALRMFASLSARDGVFAVLGNHDYYTDYRAVLRALERANVRALVNEHTIIRPEDGGGFVLAGVDDVWAPRVAPGRAMDLRRALVGAPREAARVLLAHNPKVFSTAHNAVDLQLSGHTHGGQINPASLASLALEYVSGTYRSAHGTLFVSNGFGYTGAPVRLAAPPEIAKIVLVAG